MTTDSNVYTLEPMSPRTKYSFYIDDRQAEGLKAIKERDGVLESEQIRRAIDMWLKDKGIKPPRVQKSSRPRFLRIDDDK